MRLRAKAVLLLVSIMTLMAPVSSAAPAAEEGAEQVKQSLDEMIPFSDDTKGISLKYPRNWFVQRPNDGLHVARFKAPYPGISVSICVQELKKTLPLKQFTKDINDLAVEHGSQHHWIVKVLECKPSDPIASLPTYTSTLSYDVPPPVGKSMVTEVTAVKGNIGYTFVFMAIDALHEPYMPIFEQMLKSVSMK
jgi:hypothetical protein